MHVAQHGQVGLAQLLGQGGVQGDVGSIGGRGLGRQRVAQVRARAGHIQAVVVGAGRDGRGEAEGAARNAAGSADDLDAVARGLAAQAAQVGHLHGSGAAGAASDDQLVGRAGTVAQHGAHAQQAVAAHVVAVDGQRAARRGAKQRDSAGVGQAGDCLVEAARLQRRACGHLVGRRGTEGVRRAGAQGALGNVGRPRVRVGTREGQGATALLCEEAAAGDGAGQRLMETAGVDDRVVAAGQADGVGQRQAIDREPERGAVVHGELAAAQRGAASDLDLPFLQRRAAAVAAGARQCQRAGAGLDQAAGAGDGAGVAAVGGLVRGQRPGVQRHRAARAREARGGEVPAAEVQRAAVDGVGGVLHEATRAARGQRAGLDGGATGVGAGAAQGERALAVLDDRAGTGNACSHLHRGARVDDVDAVAARAGDDLEARARVHAQLAPRATLVADAVDRDVVAQGDREAAGGVVAGREIRGRAIDPRDRGADAGAVGVPEALGVRPAPHARRAGTARPGSAAVQIPVVLAGGQGGHRVGQRLRAARGACQVHVGARDAGERSAEGDQLPRRCGEPAQSRRVELHGQDAPAGRAGGHLRRARRRAIAQGRIGRGAVRRAAQGTRVPVVEHGLECRAAGRQAEHAGGVHVERGAGKDLVRRQRARTEVEHVVRTVGIPRIVAGDVVVVADQMVAVVPVPAGVHRVDRRLCMRCPGQQRHGERRNARSGSLVAGTRRLGGSHVGPAGHVPDGSVKFVQSGDSL
ncbi:Uncharacterised protein [Xylophilus ampelinus]|nr:Uncharacterised protein [Xylophilus ampelinus]